MASNNRNLHQVKRIVIDGFWRFINNALFFMLVFFLIFIVQIINLPIFTQQTGSAQSLSVSIRAGSAADYSQDLHAYSIPPINENILEQIITEIPATGSPKDRMSTLQVHLSTSVPTMTPDDRPSATIPLQTSRAAAGSPTSTRVLSPSPTLTPRFPTATSPVVTSTPTPSPAASTSTPPPAKKNPTKEPKPTQEPKPTKEPKPTQEPRPTSEPKPTREPKPTKKP